MQVNGTTYYYVTNLQGDVMGMVDTNGNTVASYTYDPYGKVLTATGILAEKNPLRYRGYYYDSESALYYLQSRYYDPATRRFINADSYASTGQGLIGHNMFAYCRNNPIIHLDPSGHSSVVIDIWLLRFLMAATNRLNNERADRDDSTSTRNKIVNDQNGVTGDAFWYGICHANWNACETIAVHNAKVLLGRESSLSETMTDFQICGSMMLLGTLGSNPYMIGTVLDYEGIPNKRVNLDNIEEPGVYIFSFWNENRMDGIHTVACWYDGNTYTTYNLYCNGNEYTLDPRIYANDFICGYYVG